MRPLLKNEYNNFVKCLGGEPFRGIRLNTLKATEKILFDEFGILEKTPFSPFSYYCGEKEAINGKHPLHHAGAFYIQEPSATIAVTMLAPQKGDKVLDLCASPGGKSTQIACYLQNTGLLWSNEIVKSRASVLSSNIERSGVRNAVVSCCHPENLCSSLRCYFDKVLVDAPCSGEGMFRKDKTARGAWSPEQVAVCANRQKQILNSAKKALKKGGVLVYSTCTFSLEENERLIEAFLSENPDFEIMDSGESFGREGVSPVKYGRRIYPMDGGEGHFAVKLLKKSGEQSDFSYTDKPLPREILRAALETYEDIFVSAPYGERFALFGDKIYLLPKALPPLDGISVIKAGITFGEIKKNRIEPHHNAFTCAEKADLNRVKDLSKDEICRYLHGEEVPVTSQFKGFTGVSYRGIVLGFGKAVNGRLKNKYPKGLRNNL